MKDYYVEVLEFKAGEPFNDDLLDDDVRINDVYEFHLKSYSNPSIDDEIDVVDNPTYDENIFFYFDGMDQASLSLEYLTVLKEMIEKATAKAEELKRKWDKEK